MAATAYLPAGSNVCVRDTGGRARWYTTREDVLVDAPAPATCPLTRAAVQMVPYAGCVVYFQADQVRARFAADAPAGPDLKACMLMYDIPDRADIENPSGALRRTAVRINLSVWVIREGDVPYALLNRLAVAGATWHVVRFDAAEGKKLVGMAVEAIRKEMADAVGRCRRTQELADGWLDANPGDDRTAARYESRIRSIEERTAELVADLTAAAERFGIGADELGITGQMRAVQAIQTAMHARARVYAAPAATLAAAGHADMANAIDADEVPALIAADMLDDADFGSGDALRAAFQDE